MAALRKERINIDHLHRAKSNLRANLPLTYDQRLALLDVIEAGERKLYPSQMERDRYHYHFSQFFKITETGSQKTAVLETVSNGIIDYEQKYCKP